MSNISREEFEEKYRLYSQELMNISYGYTKDRDDSLDVIQNVFYKYFNSDNTFKNPDEEKYWLIRVTINESKDLLRKNKRTSILDEDTIDAIDFKNETEKEDVRLQQLARLVKELPEKYRSVIILYYYDSLSIKEIAEILNISEAAVKKRLERARDMLKKEMEE